MFRFIVANPSDNSMAPHGFIKITIFPQTGCVYFCSLDLKSRNSKHKNLIREESFNWLMLYSTPLIEHLGLTNGIRSCLLIIQIKIQSKQSSQKIREFF